MKKILKLLSNIFEKEKFLKYNWKKKILLIEDEKIIYNLYDTKLKKDWYDIKVINNWLEGLNYILNNNNKLDLIILDLQLPMMSWIEIVEKIIELGIKNNILIVSNLEFKFEFLRKLWIHKDDIILKSNIEPKDLTWLVKKKLLC